MVRRCQVMLVVLTLAGSAHASPALVVVPGGSPLTLQPPPQRLPLNPDQRGAAAAYRECAYNPFLHTSDTPSVTFEVRGATRARVVVRGDRSLGGVLLEGGGAAPRCQRADYVGADGEASFEQDFAPGQYSLFIVVYDSERQSGRGWAAALRPERYRVEVVPMASPAAAAATPTEIPHLQLSPGSRESFTLRPAALRADLHPRERGITLPACSANESLYVAREPNATFELTGPMRVRIALARHHYLGAAYLERPGMEPLCIGRGPFGIRTEVDLAPGRYSLSLVVYDAGVRDRRGYAPKIPARKLSLEITDMAPLQARLELAPNPRVIDKIRSGERATHLPRCRGFTSSAPALLLEVAGAHEELRLRPQGHGANGLVVVDEKNETHCGSQVILRNVAPGTLRVSALEARQEHFDVRIEDPTRTSAGEVRIEHEIAKRFGGASERVEIPRAPTARQELFLAAPMERFVYAARDLDRRGAYLAYGGDVVPEFPRADEPLRVMKMGGKRVVAIAADGSLFEIEASAVRLQPQGRARVPAEVRNFDLGWTDALETAAGADKRKVDAYLAADKKAGGCADRFWDKYHGGTDRKLIRVTYRGGRVDTVENYTALMLKKMRKVCGQDALGRKLERLHERLRKSEKARRASLLEKIRARF